MPVIVPDVLGQDAAEVPLTLRVSISIANSTHSRLSSTVSTCKKSQARMPEAWADRNCRQVGDDRRGAGPIHERSNQAPR